MVRWERENEISCLMFFPNILRGVQKIESISYQFGREGGIYAGNFMTLLGTADGEGRTKSMFWGLERKIY